MAIGTQDLPAIPDALFVGVDIETTGLNTQNDEIIEIAAVKWQNGRETDAFTSIIKPPPNVVNHGEHINHITPRMLSSGRPLQAVMQEFVAFVGDGVMVGHNIQCFDLPFIRTALNKCNMQSINNLVVDTLKLVKRYYPNRSRYTLESFVEELKLAQSHTHRALDDTRVCMKLLEHIIDDQSFMGQSVPLSDFLT